MATESAPTVSSVSPVLAVVSVPCCSALFWISSHSSVSVSAGRLYRRSWNLAAASRSPMISSESHSMNVLTCAALVKSGTSSPASLYSLVSRPSSRVVLMDLLLLARCGSSVSSLCSRYTFGRRMMMKKMDCVCVSVLHHA